MESEKIAARIDGETIRKFEEGKLDKKEATGLLNESELCVFALEKMKLLKADERYFCVRLDMDPNEGLSKADDILEKINARAMQMGIRDGKVLVLAYKAQSESSRVKPVDR